MEPSTGPVKEASLLPFRSFTAGGESYLYATESGGLVRVDDGVRDALSAYAASGAASIPPEILSDFRRAGLLQAVGGAGAVARTALPPFRPRTMVLMLTYACNLACRYCYEDREGCALSSAPAADPGEMSPE